MLKCPSIFLFVLMKLAFEVGHQGKTRSPFSLFFFSFLFLFLFHPRHSFVFLLLLLTSFFTQHLSCLSSSPLFLSVSHELFVLLQRKLSARSDRVKNVDFHPSEPWVLASLYNGNVYIWNYETQAVVKTFEVTELPVRTAKFIARKNWLITGADDMQVRVFNYNTHEKVTVFEAHSDYIRCIAVHPTQPYDLTSSDDMAIKLWDWENGWKNIQVFEGHSHYVMQVVFNPKDTNTFASASLDRSVKVG